jgi:hypothetical protein
MQSAIVGAYVIVFGLSTSSDRCIVDLIANTDSNSYCLARYGRSLCEKQPALLSGSNSLHTQNSRSRRRSRDTPRFCSPSSVAVYVSTSSTHTNTPYLWLTGITTVYIFVGSILLDHSILQIIAGSISESSLSHASYSCPMTLGESLRAGSSYR